MKKIILLTIIALSVIFNPIQVKAEEIPLRDIYDTTAITVDNINIIPQFVNNIETSTQSFGISGTIINTKLEPVIVRTVTKYYDNNNQQVASSTIRQTVKEASSVVYNNITDISSLEYGKIVADIKYYSMTIEVLNENDNNTNKTPSTIDIYKTKEYLIDAYDINIKVNENNTFDITENITAYFNPSYFKHGIFRKIPLKNEVNRLDGTTSKNRAVVSDVKVNNKFSMSRENNYQVIKIGDANEYVSGEVDYTISYHYNIGKDPVKEYDELYFNIIGNEWDTLLGNVTFTIEMPKEFDSTKLGFSSGRYGSTENSNIVYNVEGNTITGYYDGILQAGEGLTVRLELEEGYFVGAGYEVNKDVYKIGILLIGFLIISYLLWMKFGKDNQPIETIEFYPPKGFNSLEIAYLYKGNATSNDVISLLIYLANLGYIKISESENKVLFMTSKGFKITKLKEYDGNNINEKLFLDGLFESRHSINTLFGKEKNEQSKTEVTDTDLYNNFYITINKILRNTNTKENKNKIFEKSSTGKRWIIICMIILTYLVITVPPIYAYGDPETLLFALLFPGIGFSVMFAMLFEEHPSTVYINGKPTSSSVAPKIFGVVWGSGFGGIPWALMVLPNLIVDYSYLIIYIIGLISVVGMIICLIYLPKRTEYGNDMLGKLKGFKTFLETAEKQQLESMVNKDPTYFYRVLPYTYVLGVSDVWIKKFESIALKAPDWYNGTFSNATFATFMNNTMKVAYSSMASSPSSSSSGGSSGGGSSGGGSGGGGGGSW